ncbi:hypothetical protein [Xenophilus azovorans]|uniref:hypothetical protein n=1 Tax=Xenophilus azovorans TaxID=151755 RepID=UPI00056F1F2A|nr:hypothetical protein [Xenophilus azovorans]
MIAALRAACYRVEKSAAAGWLVSRWNIVNYCQRLADLEGFARRASVEFVPHDKRVMNAQAVAALAGHRLEREVCIDGRYRWRLDFADGRACILGTLAEVEKALASPDGASQVGGTS